MQKGLQAEVRARKMKVMNKPSIINMLHKYAHYTQTSTHARTMMKVGASRFVCLQVTATHGEDAACSRHGPRQRQRDPASDASICWFAFLI